MPDATAITNILHRYAELIDAGDFAGIGELFAGATFRVVGDDTPIDADRLVSLFEEQVIRYDDGTPRTKHVVTNAIVEFGDDGEMATARSYYTVFQQLAGGPLQPIISGRYDDRFARGDDATWRLEHRDYTLVDLVGDLSGHLRMDLG